MGWRLGAALLSVGARVVVEVSEAPLGNTDLVETHADAVGTDAKNAVLLLAG